MIHNSYHLIHLIVALIPFVRMATTFPDSLEGFGYAFNDEGQLRKINADTKKPGDEPFEFAVSSDRSYNQKHYEALGEVLTEHIYVLLETTCGLKRLTLPKGSSPEESSFIFASPDALTNPDKLLILIHGSGVVRAGQWARSLIINDSLKTGTQIPVIKQALELGYGVIVLNTNDNKCERGKIFGSESPEEHASTAWEDYVQPAAAKHIAIMAHSYGGVVTLSLASQHFSEFRDRVFAVAFTDSVHYFSRMDESEVMQLLKKIGRNWVASNKTLDTPISSHRDTPDMDRVSAGHTEHTMTTHCSHESVFKFIELRYKNVTCHHPVSEEENSCSIASESVDQCSDVQASDENMEEDERKDEEENKAEEINA